MDNTKHHLDSTLRQCHMAWPLIAQTNTIQSKLQVHNTLPCLCCDEAYTGCNGRRPRRHVQACCKTAALYACPSITAMLCLLQQARAFLAQCPHINTQTPPGSATPRRFRSLQRIVLIGCPHRSKACSTLHASYPSCVLQQLSTKICRIPVNLSIRRPAAVF